VMQERSFLEFHHIRAYARGGPATVDNIGCAAGATINTRRSWSSARGSLQGMREVPHSPRGPAAP
jgi:hypothetical protein